MSQNRINSQAAYNERKEKNMEKFGEKNIPLQKKNKNPKKKNNQTNPTPK